MSDTENSAKKSVGVPFAKGADPRRTKGVKGRGGRPTNEFRESLRALLDNPKVKAAVKAILSDKDHRQFGRVLQTVVAQAHGNPTQPIELNSGDIPVFQVITTKKDESGS